MQLDEIHARMTQVKAMLSEQHKSLESMPQEERIVFKALQAFILDVLDVIDLEGEVEGDVRVVSTPPAVSEATESLSAATSVRTLKPPSKAEREGAAAMEALTQVFRLENQGKMAEAATMRNGIFTGKVFGIRHRRTHRRCHHRCCRHRCC
jgi:hypothetical protein